MTLELAVSDDDAAIQPACSISRTVAEFAQAVDYESLPQRLREFARFHILDVVGTSLAATKFEFAHRARSGLSAAADGAWNKRMHMHAGWAGAGGITAASLARSGFIGTRKVYEGHDGLFRSHAGAHIEAVMPEALTAGLGETWRAEKVAVKPYPVCHILHACIDSVLLLKRRHHLKPDDIAQVRALLNPATFHSVCDFQELRRKPASDYIAKFSVYYTLAAALVRGRCGFAELEDEALNDPAILALAARVVYDGDSESLFPKYFSGGAVITMKDGKTFTHVENYYARD